MFSAVMTSVESGVVNLATGQRQALNTQELEKLFGDHYRALRSFVQLRAQILGVDAEDVSQEVFLRLANNKALLEKMHCGEVNPRAYLFSMANNLLVDMGRHIRVREKYEEGLQVDADVLLTPEATDPELLVAAHRDLGVLKDVIMSLKPTWRQAFLLNRFKNLSYREISEYMGVSRKQVENYMARALLRIRKTQQDLER